MTNAPEDLRARVLLDAGALRRELAGPAAPVLLDVRWALGDPHGRDHHRAGHLPGAVYVDLDTELAAPPTSTGGRHPLPELADLQATARRWGVDAGSRVVAYDATGGTAAAGPGGCCGGPVSPTSGCSTAGWPPGPTPAASWRPVRVGFPLPET